MNCHKEHDIPIAGIDYNNQFQLPSDTDICIAWATDKCYYISNRVVKYRLISFYSIS